MMADIWKAWDLLHTKNMEFFNVVKPEWLFVYTNRLRGREKHLPYLSQINRLQTTTDSKLLMSILFFKISPDKWCGKPKAQTKADERLEIIKPYIKDFYHWGEREFQEQSKILLLMLEKEEFRNELNRLFAFDKKECKKLGLKFDDYKLKPIEKRESKSLFNF